MDVLTSILLAVRRRSRAALCGGLLLAMGVANAAPTAAVDENRVKAAFLVKFGSYVEWPARAFAASSTALTIGVLGDAPLASELVRVVGGRQIDGRPVEVRDLRGGESLQGVHVLFVGDGATSPVEDVLRALDDAPALVVTEAAQLLPSGSVINFVIVDDRVRFDVALGAAERRHLKISSLLLRVARRVEPAR